MALIVETGDGDADSESYVSVADCSTYCDARGLTFSSGETADKEAALRRATQAIDAKYRSRFPGDRANGRDQALEWPRTEAYDAADEEIADDEIPQEIINATCEAAVRELAEAGSMMPDLERGGGIRSLRAGSVAVEYSGSASANTAYQLIDGILAGLLGSPQASFIGTAVRG